MAEEYELIPELGDYVTFMSDIYKTTTGIIIYRDGALIRIRPLNSTEVAIDFPLDESTGEFQESLGVSDVIIHEKRKFPQFSKQLGVLPGEYLEFLNIAGLPAQDTGIVQEVIATDDTDVIRLEDGRVLDFGFIGPVSPIVRINVRSAPENITTAENNSFIGIDEPVEETHTDILPDIDSIVLPASMVEEIPSEERTYSDSVQREDMFVSLLTDHPIARQKDPKVMARLYRITDLLLAIKNSVLQRDETGAPLNAPPISYIVNTVQDAIHSAKGAPLGAVLPVASVKKVLYADVETTQDFNDVIIRNDSISLVNALSAQNTFNQDSDTGNPFITYIHDLLGVTQSYTPTQETTVRIQVDQDVLRTRAPPTTVAGFERLPPAFAKDGSPIEVNEMSLGSIENRLVRLLNASKIKNTKTNTIYVVAPADVGEVENYILLSDELASYRTPIRSSNLLWDIARSEAGRAKSLSFYKMLKMKWESQRILEKLGEDELYDELSTRIQASLNFANRGILTVIDNLGLQNQEFSERLFQPIREKVKEGQKVWDNAYKGLARAAISRLEKQSTPIYSSTFQLPAIENTEILETINKINSRETSLAGYDLMLFHEFSTRDGSTFSPFLNAYFAGFPTDKLIVVEQNWKNESARTQRLSDNLVENTKLLQSKPIINSCIHVKELEKIRSIKDDSKRSILLDKFIKKYSAAQRANYILCSNCNKDLICKHEIMLLQEYFNPGRSAAIHKSLLLEFAGPVFEGNYICKNCGQKIREIEYDTHLEFDDEGRPLMGRTVIEEVEDDSGVAIQAEADADIPFKGADRNLYFTLRTLFELVGLAVDNDVYLRVVKAMKIYYDTFVPTEQAYSEQQARQKAVATRTGKKYTEIPYLNWISTDLIRACGALTVLELQTNPINVPISAPGCTLARNGFPLESLPSGDDGVDVSTQPVGCIEYVACALASIKRLNEPWSKVLWSTETDMKRRIVACKQAIILGLYRILAFKMKGFPELVPLETVTEQYKQLLSNARERQLSMSGVTGDILASTSDKLPSAFRPAPRVSEGEHTLPISNVARFESNLEKRVPGINNLVGERRIDLNNTIMALFHKTASESGVVQTNNPCSESVCCTRKLAVLNIEGNGIDALTIADSIKAEYSIVTNAMKKLKREDSTLPNAGTHIYVPWNAPLQTNVLPTPDSSVYYKLFLKNCYKGRRYGFTHEYNEEYVCRNCGFHMPQELIYLIPALISETNTKKYELAINNQLKERERLALAAFSSQGIEINDETFRAMEDAIKQARLVIPKEPLTITPFLNVLNKISVLLNTCDTRIREEWAIFVIGITKNITENRIGASRLAPLVEFTRKYDTLLTEFRTNLTNRARTKTRVGGALDSLKLMTETGSSHTICTNINTHFVVSASQVANKFKLKLIPIRKWFPKVNREHAENLKKIWEVLGAVVNTTVVQIEENEELVEVVSNVLRRFAATLGPIIQLWKRELRSTIGFTPAEYTQVLRWLIVHFLNALVNVNSVWYSDSPSASISTSSIEVIADWITLTLTASGNSLRKYMLSSDDIRSEVASRTEREKAMFIAKMDRQEQEMRKLELMKKKLKIGDWAVGSKNLFKYNADMYEFERAQRAAMGLPEFTEDITGEIAETQELDIFEGAPGEPGMEEGTLHRAVQDEDEEEIQGAGRLYVVC